MMKRRASLSCPPIVESAALLQRRNISVLPSQQELDRKVLTTALEVGHRLHNDFGIYHSREDALAVLHEVRKARPSWFNEACEEFVSDVAQVSSAANSIASSSGLHPLVVVEGLDGVGKTTVTTKLCANMQATLHRTPSPRFEQPGKNGADSVRELFRGQPETISRAFYCGANYLAAAEVQAARRDGPVLMDRWWGSTCSMALAGRAAKLGGSGHACELLPPPGHDVYKWPSDLPTMTLGVVLEVEESIRKMRAKLRGDEKEEERQLADREDMRKAAMSAYERMGVYHLVDVPKWPLAVNRIIDLLEERKVFPEGKLVRHSAAEIDSVKSF